MVTSLSPAHPPCLPPTLLAGGVDSGLPDKLSAGNGDCMHAGRALPGQVSQGLRGRGRLCPRGKGTLGHQPQSGC